MIDKVLAFIESNHMLRDGDTVVVGLSGGADSVALLYFLAHELPQYRLRLVACHVNHRLRGEESERDMLFAERLCRKLNAPFHILSCDVGSLARRQKIGEEECGRIVRYRFFEQIAEQYQARDENHAEGKSSVRIATAHTLSDNAETVLFRLARGTGLKGLCGIPSVYGKVIRPFLSITREQVEEYCRENRLDFLTDRTNYDETYTRNRIRLRVTPQLKQINPSYEKTFGGTLESLCADEDCLSSLAEEAALRIQCSEGYDAAALAKEHCAVRRRVLVRLACERGVSLSREKIAEFDKIILSGTGKINMADDLHAQVKDGVLSFEVDKAPAQPFAFPFSFGRLTFPSGTAYNISVAENWENSGKVNKNFSIAVLDYDKIKGNPVFRSRQAGDKISLPRRGVTKSLKKLYNESKIPLHLRDRLAVLCDEEGLVWAEGYGEDSRVQCSSQTKRFLLICSDGDERAMI